MNRREFLRISAAAGAAATLPPVPALAAYKPMADVPFAAHKEVRIGLIGVGARGKSLLRDFLGVDGVRVTALCDIVRDDAARGAGMVKEAGQNEPALFTAGERDFEKLCRRDDIDLVVIATPWDWHVPMAVSAMRQGKHAAVEVPAATTIEGCWELVTTSERTRRHCVMLENVCYGYNEMLVLNLVRAGVLGDILHGEAAYIHDLREILFQTKSEGLWRREPHIRRNGNLYPTHGLGPVAQYMGVNRGDRFDYIVSMSTPEAGLSARRAKLPATDPRSKERYRCGDMNTSLIKTRRGRTIMLQHDVVSPRPYDRINMVSGTRGAFRDYPARIYVEGQEGGEKWTGIDSYKAEHEHPLWKTFGAEAARKSGHGGMDFIMAYRLIQCMRDGLPPDMDVYDAAAWSAPGPLSDRSVAIGSAPVKFPDFTRGLWRNRETGGVRLKADATTETRRPGCLGRLR